MPLFPKNVHFGFLQIRWSVEGVNMVFVIKRSFLMQQVSLYLNTNLPRKSPLCSSWKSELYIISRAESEGRLDLKGSTGRSKKVLQRVERKIIRTVYDNSQSSTRGGVEDFHETISNILQKFQMTKRD